MLATLKQWLSKDSRVLLTTVTITGIVLGLRWFGLLQRSELAFLDLFFRLRPLEAKDERVVIVGINETDIQMFRHPIPDESLAKLLEKIHQYQPIAIGLDIYRDLPIEPDGYPQLVQAFQNIPNIIGIEKLESSVEVGVRPSPILQEKNQVGFNNVVNDPDGKVRRGLLYLHRNGKARQSFALTLSLIYLQKHQITPQSAAENPQYLQLGKAVFRPFQPNDGGYVKVDNGGYQFLANLRGGTRTFTQVSMADVVSGNISPDLMTNKIVLIGYTADSLKDFQNTSYSDHFLKSPEKMAGVELQANFISQILSAALEGRTAIHVWPDPLEWLWILFWSWTGAALSWKLESPRDSVASILLLSVGLMGTSYLIFLQGWWLPVVPALITLVGSAITIIGYLANLQEEFKRSKEFLQTVINTIPDPIFVKDIHHRRIVLNRAYCEFIGYPLNLLMSKTDYDLFPEHEADIFWQQDEQVFTTGKQSENEEQFTDAQSKTHLIATKRTLHKDAAGNLFLVGVIRDITERKMMEEQLKHIAAELERSNAELRLSEDLLRYQAHHDTLTGLPNRKLFQERLSQSIEWAISNNKSVGLLFLDLDGFKTINDTLGHNMGDLLLKGIAERLRGCLRGSDTVSRLGGDEFTVILPGIPSKADAARVAEKVRDTIRPVFNIEGHQLFVTTSIGISIYPEDAEDLETLIKNSDVAMYRAKEQGKNRYEFVYP